MVGKQVPTERIPLCMTNNAVSSYHHIRKWHLNFCEHNFSVVSPPQVNLHAMSKICQKQGKGRENQLSNQYDHISNAFLLISKRKIQ